MGDFSRWVRDTCIDCGADRAAANKFERNLRREWGAKRVYIGGSRDRTVSPRRHSATIGPQAIKNPRRGV